MQPVLTNQAVASEQKGNIYCFPHCLRNDEGRWVVLAGVLPGILRTVLDGTYTVTFCSDTVVAGDIRGCWTNDL